MYHTTLDTNSTNSYTTGDQTNPLITSLSDGGWVVTWTSAAQDGSGVGVFQQAYNADGTLLGGETLVNSFTTGEQSDQHVTALSGGGWVVTWSSYGGQDGDGVGVFQQVYDQDGVAKGSETQVNAYTTGIQYHSQITALADGGWVVTWESFGQGGNGSGLYQKAYDADGSALGGETKINISGNEGLIHQQVAALVDGGWAITWIGFDADSYGIHMQAYNADGSPLGSERLANTYATSIQYNPTVVGLSNGGWVVTWDSNGQDEGNTDGVYQQAYNPDGTPLGTETRVNTYTPWPQGNSQIAALPGGAWVVTWMSIAQDNNGYGVYQQIYNADGTAHGGETQVHSSTVGNQWFQQIATLSDGGWVVAWATSYGDSDGIYLQAFNADGTRQGAETHVGSYAAGDQTSPHITALADGGWVVTWSSAGRDGDGVGVYQQRYDADGEVHGINHAPSAADNTLTTLEDTGNVFSVTDFGFSDPTDGDILSGVKITVLPDSGTLTLDGVAVSAGDIITAANIAGGKLVWTPDANAHGNGLDSLTFKVVDDGGTEGGGANMSAAHTITFYVTAVNDAPVGADETATTLEDTAYTLSGGDFGFSSGVDDYQDIEGSAPGRITIAVLPTNGTLTLNGAAVAVDDVITFLDIDAGKLVWTPDANHNGTGIASLVYKISDNGGTANGGHDTAAHTNTLTFNVTAVNDAPEAVDATRSVNEGYDVVLAPGAFNYSDIDGNAFDRITIDTLPLLGTLKLDGEEVHVGDVISFSDIDAFKLIWTPPANTFGNEIASFSYKISDDGGTAYGGHDTSAQSNTISFNVSRVNDAPDGTDSTISVLEDGSHAFTSADFGFADGDGDSFKSVIITALPGSGTLTLDGSAVAANQEIDVGDIDGLIWTPVANSNGADLATLEFKVVDDGETNTGGHDTDQIANSLTFDVTSVNDAPSGANKTMTVREDHSFTFSQNAFGFADPLDGDALSAVVITALPRNGTLKLDGVAVSRNQIIDADDLSHLVWKPAKDAFGDGLATMTFKVIDDGGSSSGGHDRSAASTFTFNVTDETDTLRGTKSADRLVGTAGHDILIGKAGNDKLSGRDGSDTFVFSTNFDKDTITDFQAKGSNHDIADLRGLKSISSFSDIKANHLSEHGHDVWIDGGNGDILVLQNTEIKDLGKSDFLF